jgi:L-ascorbate metabolism protein UlaG (beta-lactamase superfamily)
MPVSATLDWYGCATFRLTVGDTVVFLDAYIDRVPDAEGPGASADDVDRADWILVGHSHFDHLWGAERIAKRTGATIVGSYETVRVMAAQGVPEAQLLPVSGGERVQLTDDIFASVFPSLHSCVWTHNSMRDSHEVCIGDLGVTHQDRMARLDEMRRFMGSQLDADAVAHVMAGNQDPRGDGGALVFLLETPAGTLLYQDTSGYWTGIVAGIRPDVAILAAAGRGHIDGEPIQGTLADFVARQAALVRPRAVLLSHHDNWLPGFSVATDTKPIREQLALFAPRSELVEIGYLDGYPLFS